MATEGLKLYREESGAARHAHFALALEPGFRQTRAEEEMRLAGAGLRLEATDGVVRAGVSVARLRMEADALDWARILVEENGHVVRTAGERGGQQWMATAAARGGEKWSALWRVERNRDLVFLVHCACRKEHAGERAEWMNAIPASFRLLHPENTPVEPRKEWSFDLGGAKLRGDRPASCVEKTFHRDRARGILTCQFQIMNGGAAAGAVMLMARPGGPEPRQAADALVRNYYELIAGEGFRLTGGPVLPDAGRHALEQARLHVQAGWMGAEEAEMSCLSGVLGGRAVALGLLAPGRRQNARWWAVAKRYFEIVRDSIKLEQAG